MKRTKKALSLLLSAILIMASFSVGFSNLKLDAAGALQYDANGDIIIDGVTQTRIVGTDGTYPETFAAHALNYSGGVSEATNILVPGLAEAQNYVIQGMSYYPQRDWMLVTAYHNNDSPSSSKVFCLDAASGEFVAMLSFLNVDGTTNTDHGGGIAISENNIYYSCGDQDRSLAYAPLAALEGIEVGEHRVIQLVDEITLYETGSTVKDGKTAYTAYVCYDQGVLWTGNFYDAGIDALVTEIAADYNAPANGSWDSMVWGYKLHGENSEDEWAYIKNKHNYVNLSTTGTTVTGTGASMTYTATESANHIDITGNITFDGTVASVGELTSNFAYVYLSEGSTYTIEYTTNNKLTDMYMFAPNGKHCNVKQSTDTKITDNGNGTYTYSMTFTAGLKPANADSSWPTTQSTDGSFTGKYTIRFDQDTINAARDVAITGFNITAGDGSQNATEKASAQAGIDCQGNPSYAIALGDDADTGTDVKNVQYATVDNGKLYLSCSYGTGAGGSTTVGYDAYSSLHIADIDLSVPGTSSIDGITVDAAGTTKTLNGVYVITEYDTIHMPPMSEGLCVIDDYIYMTFESASYKYYKDAGILGNCEVPIDVVWKIDQYAASGIERPNEEKSLCYEQVTSKADIVDGEEYIIVYESAEKEPVTQNKYLYALDSNGGYHEYNLSKHNESDNDGYIGAQGRPIIDYTYTVNDEGKNVLYFNDADKDDVANIRWIISGANSGNLRIKGTDTYFAYHPYFYFNANTLSMAGSDVSDLSNIVLTETGTGEFYISNGGYYLWCNDGYEVPSYTTNANTWYQNNSASTAMYTGVTEQKGTFHTDGLNATGSNIISGGVTSFDHGAFKIFKRVIDPFASTAESRVYTDMNAELQADGTYTINLETYATGTTQNINVAERPTDFIFVLDASASMATNNDATGYDIFTAFDLEAAAGNSDVSSHTNSSTNSGESGTYTGDMYVRHTDGRMCRVSVRAQGDGRSGSFLSYTYYQKVYLWYTHPDTGVVYWFHPTSTSSTTGTWSTTETTYEEALRIGAKNQEDRRNTHVYTGTCYQFKTGGAPRLDVMITAVEELSYKIASEPFDHRISLVQFGCNADESWYNTGMYSSDATYHNYTGSGTISSTTYSNAFFTKDNFESFRGLVRGINSDNGDADTYVDYGVDMANQIIANSDSTYLSDGTRSVAVIIVTDGVPGIGTGDLAKAKASANAAIFNAHTAKKAGASVYTMQMTNDSLAGFNMALYMDYLSSNYPDANSLNDPGNKNSIDVDYYLEGTVSNAGFFDSFINSIYNSVQANSTRGLAMLNATSVLKDELSLAFEIPTTDWSIENNVTSYLVPGEYDAIGRVRFYDPVETDSIKVLTSGQTFNISGYDYSSNYIAKGSTNGKKLRVTITGLLANEVEDITNTSINNADTTAIYHMNMPVKYFPKEYFNIPEYVYVLDFGMKMYDNDINGTIKALANTLDKQDINNYTTSIDSGMVEITNNNLDMIYSHNPEYMEDSGYILIQRDTGKYDWFEIKVVPASNVLYEETEFETKASDNVDWTVAGGTPKATYQSLSNADTDVYGNDDVYAVGENAYSNNTAIKTTVNKTNKRSDSAVFTFQGTGFDLISACGANTGMQIVTVRKADNSIAKVMIVDTYYNDTTYVDATNKVLNQVPIASFSGEHGKYTVEVTATYLSYAGALSGKSASRVVKGASVDATAAAPVGDAEIAAMLKSVGMGELAKEDVEVIWFDDNSIFNGGTGAEGIKSTRGTRAGTGVGVTELVNYIDGIRIYHPMDANYGDYIKGEQGAQYVNVIDNLANESLGDGGTAFGLAYVEGSLAEGEALSFANYQKIGPENEFYLAAGNSDTTTGLAFNIDAPTGSTIMLGLRAINGATTVKVNGKEFAVNSATEMYYNITGILDGATTITIANTGSSPLAVNNIKLAGNAAVGALSLDDMGTIDELMTMETVEAEVVNGTVTVPVPEEEPEIPEDETDNDGESSTLFNILDMIMAIIGEFLKTIMSFMG